MGMFSDLRKIMKTSRELQKEHGSGLKDALSRGADMLGDAASVLGDHKRQARIVAEGRDGTATIDAVRDNGMTLNERPVLEFDLQVTVGGFGPYPATVIQAVSRPAVARLQPGAEVDVKVDPENPQGVVMVASES